MKANHTELVFILDRSGSMAGLESDVIGGYNAMLAKQKQEPGTATVTTVLFDNQCELLHDRIDLAGIAPITPREYSVRGCTALLDAMGMTIQKIINVQRHTIPKQQAGRVLFVISTDGMENASRKYTFEEVRALVERQQQKYGWEFLFLGANIDAIATAGRFGIAPNRAVNYHADGRGTRLNFETVSRTVSHVRKGKPIADDWKREIEEDFKSR